MNRTIVIGALAVMLLATTGFALPEYAVRYNQTCALCHYNPTGGGMRTLYGAQFFSYTDLPDKPKTFEALQEMMPKAGDRLQYGFDVRSLYALTESPAEDEDIRGNEFVLMQADAYFAYSLSDATSVIVDVSNNGIEEAFGMHTGWNGKLQIRAGRFRSTYGWGFVDHTSYVRRFLDYGSLRGAGLKAYDTGLEGGVYFDRWDLTLGISNGIPGNNGNDLYARYARRFALGDLTATLGGSGRYMDVGKGGELLWQRGLFYGASLGRLAFIGETDQYLYQWGTGDMTSLTASHLLRFTIHQGLYANAWYEYHDKDMDTASGYNQRVRFGLDYVPRGYLAISPMIEYNQEELDTNAEQSYAQFTLQLHLWL